MHNSAGSTVCCTRLLIVTINSWGRLRVAMTKDDLKPWLDSWPLWTSAVLARTALTMHFLLANLWERCLNTLPHETTGYPTDSDATSASVP